MGLAGGTSGSRISRPGLWVSHLNGSRAASQVAQDCIQIKDRQIGGRATVRHPDALNVTGVRQALEGANGYAVTGGGSGVCQPVSGVGEVVVLRGHAPQCGDSPWRSDSLD